MQLPYTSWVNDLISLIFTVFFESWAQFSSLFTGFLTALHKVRYSCFSIVFISATVDLHPCYLAITLPSYSLQALLVLMYITLTYE